LSLRLERNDEWLLQRRYMQIEEMAELTPPLIDADPAKPPPWRPNSMATSNSCVYAALTEESSCCKAKTLLC
jgi:hypothetical protein